MSDSPALHIHPTAVVDPAARIGPGCRIGPHAVIDGHVVLGPGCEVGPGAYITGHTSIGARNRIHAGAVLGDSPQDLKYDGAPTRLRIGDDNTFREHVTIHRSSRPDHDTVIGNGNLFMAGSHVGHNCHLGDHNILANGALLAGHVTLDHRAFISGSCLVHQFCRVGRLALMQGGAAISRDLPPFCIARGDNGIAGLNVIGLRRAGFKNEDRTTLRAVYRRLFRSRQPLAANLAAARTEFVHSDVAMELIDFVAAARRGVCRDTGSRTHSRPDTPESDG